MGYVDLRRLGEERKSIINNRLLARIIARFLCLLTFICVQVCVQLFEALAVVIQASELCSVGVGAGIEMPVRGYNIASKIF
jgi:hypothetical protein